MEKGTSHVGKLARLTGLSSHSEPPPTPMDHCLWSRKSSSIDLKNEVIPALKHSSPVPSAARTQKNPVMTLIRQTAQHPRNLGIPTHQTLGKAKAEFQNKLLPRDSGGGVYEPAGWGKSRLGSYRMDGAQGALQAGALRRNRCSAFYFQTRLAQDS